MKKTSVGLFMVFVLCFLVRIHDLQLAAHYHQSYLEALERFWNFQDASFSLDIRHRYRRVQLLGSFEICLNARITERILRILENLLIIQFLFNLRYVCWKVKHVVTCAMHVTGIISVQNRSIFHKNSSHAASHDRFLPWTKDRFKEI